MATVKFKEKEENYVGLIVYHALMAGVHGRGGRGRSL